MDSRRSRRTDTEKTESMFGRAAGQTVYEPVDAEDDPFTPPVDTKRSRRDSQSTFFGRNDDFGEDNEQPRQSGGRTSLYGQPRQEPVKGGAPWEEDNGGAFDIYADFNNVGPRYSGAQTLETIAPPGNNGCVVALSDLNERPILTSLYYARYRNLSTPPASVKGGHETEPVELVTVPRFGPEWTKDELRSMTGRGRSEDQKIERRQRWREWNQDRRGLFGKRWLTRKVMVWTTFFVIIL